MNKYFEFGNTNPLYDMEWKRNLRDNCLNPFQPWVMTVESNIRPKVKGYPNWEESPLSLAT